MQKYVREKVKQNVRNARILRVYIYSFIYFFALLDFFFNTRLHDDLDFFNIRILTHLDTKTFDNF